MTNRDFDNWNANVLTYIFARDDSTLVAASAVSECAKGEARANAAHIVKCVNSHNELVAAPRKRTTCF